jgi:hypothetical protein
MDDVVASTPLVTALALYPSFCSCASATVRLTKLSSATRIRVVRLWKIVVVGAPKRPFCRGLAGCCSSRGNQLKNRVEREGGTLTFPAIDTDGSPHHLDNLLADRQSQACAAVLARRGGVCLGEWREQRRTSASKYVILIPDVAAEPCRSMRSAGHHLVRRP